MAKTRLNRKAAIKAHPDRAGSPEMSECQHAEVYWYPANNEEGWKCTCGFRPGEPPGYDPQRDRDSIEDKATGIFLELLAQGWLCQMGSDQGDDMVRSAVRVCQQRHAYDQHTIIVALMEYRDSSHAAYWKEIGDGVVDGNDPRHRCQGGNLATVTSYKGGGGHPVRTCMVEGCACQAQRGLFA